MQLLPPRHRAIVSAEAQRCPACGAVAQRLGIRRELLGGAFSHRFSVWMDCPGCGIEAFSVMATYVDHPAVQQFLQAYARPIFEPEQAVDYAGQSVLRCGLADVASTAQLTVLVHPETFQVLATWKT